MKVFILKGDTVNHSFGIRFEVSSFFVVPEVHGCYNVIGIVV